MGKPITSYSLEELQDFLKTAGQPAFRRKQLLDWVYVRQARSYEEMTNLPLALRTLLEQEAPLAFPEIISKRVSSDGTQKYIFRFHDGACVESVAIPSRGSKDRLTVCFSTQVGCAMECGFCATGTEGFSRNLGMGEMIFQILIAEADMGQRVSNIVAMGQGEPFLNYRNVADALKVLNDPKGIAIGARHITVSTCGIIPGIHAFAEEAEQYTLAISLHAARQGTRDSLMPRVAKFPLHDLKDALLAYVGKTGRRVTLEYLLIDGVNDTAQDIDALFSFCKGLHCHVNLLPMNAVKGSPYQPSTRETVDQWLARFAQSGIEATVRASRGSDIEGACGQLKNALGY